MSLPYKGASLVDAPYSFATTEPVQFSLDPYVGGTWKGKPILPLTGTNSVTSHIDTGLSIHASNGVITYTFLDKDHLTGLYNNPNVGFTAQYGLSVFTPEQETAARNAIQLWDDLIPQTFKETSGMGADIMFANSLDPAQAYSYYPGKQGWKFQSDVFVNDPSVDNVTNKWFDFGGYGNTTLIHELGHTLGLSHPGAYNFGPGFSATYANGAEYAQDSMQYSIMSYWSGSNTAQITRDWLSQQANYPQTPMLHDIYVIQEKYGADPTTRATDTTYGFNSNAGNAVYDFSHNPYPNLSIYDAGGTDTIDLSGFTAGQFLDLHPGSFSSVGAAVPSLADVNAARAALGHELGLTLQPYTQTTLNAAKSAYLPVISSNVAFDTGVTGVAATEFSNLSIAYNTIIENGIGGSARDVLWGNDVANVLKGMGGDDVIRGFGGNDTLWGGDGNDTFVFDKDGSTDTIADFQTGHDKIDLSNVAGATASWVTYDAAHNRVAIDTDHNGTADMFINIAGSAPVTSDFIFHA
ncbi:M10 family metallopeptidase C-terminal domain-containing protein [Sphingomonas agri]|uniref:M10 family metallopeptidase C-terminal domain-containing protein n=1 Tax=Sphingomonas agri TaxID=1813878 RepID=UPI00311F70E3